MKTMGYIKHFKLSVIASSVVWNLACVNSSSGASAADPANPEGDVTPLPAHCLNTDVYHWDLPIYWEQANSPKFTYYFQFQKATVGNPATAPLGIFINGGAGAPSIGFESGRVFPPTFNVIWTDVRGVGCNAKPDNPFKADALTTEYFSRDVLSIVQVLGLTQYVLYGISYGTVQATVMAEIAKNEGIQTPTAVVLEGTVGRWDSNNHDYDFLNREWNNVKTILPANVVASMAQTTPFGISSSDWNLFIHETLNAGTTPSLGNATYYYLAPLGSSNPAVVAAYKTKILDKIAAIKAKYSPELVALATILHCTETAGSVHETDFVNGQFIEVGSDICPYWGVSFIKPYDPAQHLVNVPIYYFQGANDPATNPEGATYHFDHQTQSNRKFTLIAGGGHPAMSTTLHEKGCTPAIFYSIVFNPAGVDAAIQTCNWSVTITNKGVGQ